MALDRTKVKVHIVDIDPFVNDQFCGFKSIGTAISDSESIQSTRRPARMNGMLTPN